MHELATHHVASGALDLTDAAVVLGDRGQDDPSREPMSGRAASPAPQGKPGRRNLVVVGFDGSSGAEAALEQAVVEAKIRGAELEIAVSWRHWPVESLIKVTPDITHNATAIAARGADLTASIAADLVVHTRVSPEPAPIELVAESKGAELLVVGQRGLGAWGMILGSVSQYCVHHASCPVLVTRAPAGHRDVRGDGAIVVGFDGSDGSRRALKWAATEACLRSSPLRVVDAWGGREVFVTPSEVEGATHARVETAMSELRLRYPTLRAEAFTVESATLVALLAASDDATLLVVGSRGMGGFHGLDLGSVGLHCLHHAGCPVVVVPPTWAAQRVIEERSPRCGRG